MLFHEGNSLTLGCVINVAVVLKLMFSIKPLHANLFLQAMQRNAKTSQPLLIGSSSFLFWLYYTMIFVVFLWTYLVFTTENSISNHFPISQSLAYKHICYISILIKRYVQLMYISMYVSHFVMDNLQYAKNTKYLWNIQYTRQSKISE